MTWEPIWALPNIDLDEPINNDSFALVPPSDPRVQAFKREHQNFQIFMRQFQDTHGSPIKPTLIIRKTDVSEQLKTKEAAASFRDLLVASIVPLARSEKIIYDNYRSQVLYSDSFWLYPWMLDRNNESIVASTPAMWALHDVRKLKGHSSPELPRVDLCRRDFDEPLLQELLRRWTTCYEIMKPEWSDIALFRSLNMANQACLIPAGADAGLYDFGRMAGLWVAAFEILVHPGGNGQANLGKVFDLFHRVVWIDTMCGHRRFKTGQRQGSKRVNLACWLYEHIYLCRNNFLHGNSVTSKDLFLPQSGRDLIFHAATLYRLALTSFLELIWKEPFPATEASQDIGEYIAKKMAFDNPQISCEHALKLSRVSAS